jgi:hypothetical protein
MNRFYGCVLGLRGSQMMKAPVVFRRRSPLQQNVSLSAVLFPRREDLVRMEVTAGHLEDWKGLLEGVLPIVSDVLEPLWRRRPLYVRRSLPNNRMQQTVQPVTGRAKARPAPGRPAADA